MDEEGLCLEGLFVLTIARVIAKPRPSIWHARCVYFGETMNRPEQFTRAEFVIATITALALVAATALMELHKREHERAMEPVPTENARYQAMPDATVAFDSVSGFLDTQESLRS